MMEYSHEDGSAWLYSNISSMDETEMCPSISTSVQLSNRMVAQPVGAAFQTLLCYGKMHLRTGFNVGKQRKQ